MEFGKKRISYSFLLGLVGGFAQAVGAPLQRQNGLFYANPDYFPKVYVTIVPARWTLYL